MLFAAAAAAAPLTSPSILLLLLPRRGRPLTAFVSPTNRPTHRRQLGRFAGVAAAFLTVAPTTTITTTTARSRRSFASAVATDSSSRARPSHRPTDKAKTVSTALDFSAGSCDTDDDDNNDGIIMTTTTTTRENDDGIRPQPSPPHVKARSQENPSYPQRFPVSDDVVPWSVPFPAYDPPRYTHPAVLANDRTIKDGGWADPPDPASIAPEEYQPTGTGGGGGGGGGRASYEGTVEMEPDGSNRPRNPRGRTGLADRGLLGKWGPNFAADPIVTRYRPPSTSSSSNTKKDDERRQLQVVAIRRKDTGAWALPGGMVDPGESISQTLQREFEEEAGNLSDPDDVATFQRLTDDLFKNHGIEVYRGYVDDPRNTDHAWMETNAVHYHCNGELGRLLPLHAGDDAADVTWLNVNVDGDGGGGGVDERFRNLYASHRGMVLEAAARLTNVAAGDEEEEKAGGQGEQR